MIVIFLQKENIYIYILNSFLHLRISSNYWNSKEFIFRYMPWLVYWASTPGMRACPYYCFLCSWYSDAESNQISWADPEDISCLFPAPWHYLFGLGKLERNACFLLKCYRLSSPRQVLLQFIGYFYHVFFWQVLGRKTQTYSRVSFTYLVLWNVRVI